MSFSVNVKDTNFEYCGKGLKGIFAKKTNLFNIKFLRMFYDIISFYKRCYKINEYSEKITLGQFLTKEKMSKSFIE